MLQLKLRTQLLQLAGYAESTHRPRYTRLTNQQDGTPGKFGSSSSEPLASESRGEGLKMPLFAHEGLGGAYEFADDRFDHHALDDSDSGRSRSSSRNFTFDELDLTDPTIEKFPSDRGSVLNTLRKIQSSSSQDYAVTDDLSKSPRACAKNLGTGIDDSGRQSNGSLNPVSPNSSRRRDGRASMSSFGRSKSPASLGCIDEEPKASSTGLSISRTKCFCSVF